MGRAVVKSIKKRFKVGKFMSELQSSADNSTKELTKAVTKPSGRAQRKIYLDYNATTPLNERVIQGLSVVARIWGNPSSIHWAGRGPKSLIREARQSLASMLSVSPLELVFTSGGSEANNTVIRGVFEYMQNTKSSRNEYITSAIEHPSVKNAFYRIQELGAIVHVVDVNRHGQIDLERFQKLLSEKTALVSIMLANNETGVVLPIQKMAKLAEGVGALFHSDCVQSLGKMTLNLDKLGVHYASFSAHKMYALKGVGALYIKKGSPYLSLIEGGPQERHRRGGTENAMGIWSFGEMARELENMSEKYVTMKNLRDYFEQRVCNEISQVKITAQNADRLPNTSSLIIDHVNGETLLMSLDLKGFAVSTGAACSSGSPEPSPTLLAMGLSRVEAQSSLRVSLGWDTSKDQIDVFIDELKEIVLRLRSLPHFIEEPILSQELQVE